ncbi:MAG: Brp/Blh family beta-carotene 15,15'-dioxygenase [Bacteroidetes bacterium]|nr:Brp/Blh family beta-carotene 15,15'-dioxygenase [Bacteroidota bacterium]MDA1333899.1 Brp/Blh family beta-carotene 15,15'-dioxygenase [Bacteroidota bacterium]
MPDDKIPLWILIATILGSALGWLVGGGPSWILYLPWALSVFIYGVPHGASDHVIWASFDQSPVTGRFFRAICGYLLVMGVYGILWWMAPVLAAGLFVGITIWHWGSADAYRSFSRAAVPLMGAGWFGASIARGLTPIMAPLVFYPEVVAKVIGGWSSAIDPVGLASWIPEWPVMLVVVLVFQACWLGAMTMIGAPLQTEVVETVIVTTLLLFVHPILSVGIYFTFWHAWYHDKRLSAWYGSRNAFLESRSKRHDQLLIMGITVAGLISVFALFPGGRPAFAFYLIAISILTMPHMIVVWKMDQFESRQAGQMAA